MLDADDVVGNERMRPNATQQIGLVSWRERFEFVRNAVSDKCEGFTEVLVDIESDDGGLSAKTRAIELG